MFNFSENDFSILRNLYFPRDPIPRTSPVPAIVYRIYGDTSVSRPFDDWTFLAGAPYKRMDARNQIQVREEVEKHADWYNRQHTAFVSTTSSFDWMLYQAQRSITPQERCGWRGDVRIAVIDTANAIANGFQIYKMSDLVSWSGAQIPIPARGPSMHEWVFLHSIPGTAVRTIYRAFDFYQLALYYNASLRLFSTGTVTQYNPVEDERQYLEGGALEDVEELADSDNDFDYNDYNDWRSDYDEDEAYEEKDLEDFLEYMYDHDWS